VDTTRVIRHLCQAFSIQQDLYSRMDTVTFDIYKWSCSRSARRALMHSSAVLQLVTSLSFGRMQSIHVPLAVLISSIIFITLCLAGRSKASLPSEIDWEMVCKISLDMEHANQAATASSATAVFLDTSHAVWDVPYATRSFRYNVNTLQTVLESLSSTWGVASKMRDIIQQLLSLSSVSGPAQARQEDT
jgi:hypothetical protein